MDGAGEGFERFFRTTYPRVVAWLILQGLERETAQDAAKEAMTELLARWNAVQHPNAWVWKVAWRAAMRLKGADIAPLPDDELRSVHEGWESAVDLRISAEAAIRTLPTKQREVMTLTLAGRTPAEIAKILERPGDQVRGNLREARRALRAIFVRSEEE